MESFFDDFLRPFLEEEESSEEVDFRELVSLKETEELVRETGVLTGGEFLGVVCVLLTGELCLDTGKLLAAEDCCGGFNFVRIESIVWVQESALTTSFDVENFAFMAFKFLIAISFSAP
ncbi:MAG: hypothetical protein JSS60_07395 [Verrucomicrobia bacterium]|nr:hypothetical protein [Verrucomicrobiota bacterium]